MKRRTWSGGRKNCSSWKGRRKEEELVRGGRGWREKGNAADLAGRKEALQDGCLEEQKVKERIERRVVCGTRRTEVEGR